MAQITLRLFARATAATRRQGCLSARSSTLPSPASRKCAAKKGSHEYARLKICRDAEVRRTDIRKCEGRLRSRVSRRSRNDVEYKIFRFPFWCNGLETLLPAAAHGTGNLILVGRSEQQKLGRALAEPEPRLLPTRSQTH